MALIDSLVAVRSLENCSVALIDDSLSYDIDEHDTPQSLVAKLPTSDPNRRKQDFALGIYEREVRFYEEIAAEISTRTAFPPMT